MDKRKKREIVSGVFRDAFERVFLVLSNYNRWYIKIINCYLKLILCIIQLHTGILHLK